MGQHCKMRVHQVSIFLLLALSKGLATTQLPRFQAYWESQLSYLYNDDELSNPWHIDLGNIDVGPLGYLSGPSVVTIDSADYCVSSCQEHWPDEFCSKYPPEGCQTDQDMKRTGESSTTSLPICLQRELDPSMSGEARSCWRTEEPLQRL